jgi:hypothetical protein
MTSSAIAVDNISGIPAVIGIPAVVDILSVVEVEGPRVPQI